MKTQLLLITGFCIILFTNSSGQNIPNWDFESWENRYLYQEPVSWNTGNQEAFLSDTETVFQSENSYSGDYCLRLETVVTEEDTLFGYAFCDGSVTGGSIQDTFQFTGGIPVSGVPDSLFGYLMYEMAPNDTGVVLVSFKSNGNYISQNIYPVFGSQSDYTKVGWDIPAMGETPDTVLIAFACTNPDDSRPGGWMQIDSLWFEGIDDPIPNADFEDWEEYTYQEPADWITANLFSYLFGGDTIVTPTEDAHSGSYAMRIESAEVMIPGDSGFTNSVVGFGMPYTTSFDFTESLPTFEVDFNPVMLTGYYKFEPLSNDTAFIYITLFDEQGYVDDYGSYLFPADQYTLFTLNLDYPTDNMVTEVSLVVSTTTYFMPGDGQSGEVGSVLYLDDLRLVNLCETLAGYEIVVDTFPTCSNGNIATINAGEGWDEYLWSNGETTQVISVPILDNIEFSVTVTDNETRCEFSDDILIELTCIEDKIEGVHNQLAKIEVYPNPASGIVTLEFSNLKQGNYIAEVADITGKSVIRKHVSIHQNHVKLLIDMTEYPEGLYMVRIAGNNFNHCERLLLK